MIYMSEKVIVQSLFCTSKGIDRKKSMKKANQCVHQWLQHFQYKCVSETSAWLERLAEVCNLRWLGWERVEAILCLWNPMVMKNEDHFPLSPKKQKCGTFTSFNFLYLVKVLVIVSGIQHCITYFSHHCDQVLDMKQPQGRSIYSGSQFEWILSIMVARISGMAEAKSDLLISWWARKLTGQG